MSPYRADPFEFSLRWPVRGYELDSRGHVNNAVYLSWAEEIATAHAEAAGYGREWSARQGGGWVIRKTEITYHRPAVYGDEVELTVKVELVRGARGVRRTGVNHHQEVGEFFFTVTPSRCTSSGSCGCAMAPRFWTSL